MTPTAREVDSVSFGFSAVVDSAQPDGEVDLNQSAAAVGPTGVVKQALGLAEFLDRVGVTDSEIQGIDAAIAGLVRSLSDLGCSVESFGSLSESCSSGDSVSAHRVELAHVLRAPELVGWAESLQEAQADAVFDQLQRINTAFKQFLDHHSDGAIDAVPMDDPERIKGFEQRYCPESQPIDKYFEQQFNAESKQGGMGQLIFTYDRYSGVEYVVAIKRVQIVHATIQQRVAGPNDPDTIDEFTAGLLTNVGARTFDAVRKGNYVYIAMHRVEGKDASEIFGKYHAVYEPEKVPKVPVEGVGELEVKQCGRLERDGRVLWKLAGDDPSVDGSARLRKLYYAAYVEDGTPCEQPVAGLPELTQEELEFLRHVKVVTGGEPEWTIHPDFSGLDQDQRRQQLFEGVMQRVATTEVIREVERLEAPTAVRGLGQIPLEECQLLEVLRRVRWRQRSGGLAKEFADLLERQSERPCTVRELMSLYEAAYGEEVGPQTDQLATNEDDVSEAEFEFLKAAGKVTNESGAQGHWQLDPSLAGRPRTLRASMVLSVPDRKKGHTINGKKAGLLMERYRDAVRRKTDDAFAEQVEGADDLTAGEFKFLRDIGVLYREPGSDGQYLLDHRYHGLTAEERLNQVFELTLERCAVGQELSQATVNKGEEKAKTARGQIVFRSLVSGVQDLSDRMSAQLHDQGIIHRDMKPANVMFDINTGEWLVVDLGVVQRLDMFFGDTPSMAGTRAFFAPEQLTGKLEDLDRRTDVFCLGGVLYNLLSGHPPYSGNTAKVLEMKARTGDYPPLGQPRARRPLESICLKAMAVDPDDRYGDAAELAEDLGTWLSGGEVLVHSAQDRMYRWGHKFRRNKAVVYTIGAVSGLVVATGGLIALADNSAAADAEVDRAAAVKFYTDGDLSKAIAAQNRALDTLQSSPGFFLGDEIAEAEWTLESWRVERGVVTDLDALSKFSGMRMPAIGDQLDPFEVGLRKQIAVYGDTNSHAGVLGALPLPEVAVPRLSSQLGDAYVALALRTVRKDEYSVVPRAKYRLALEYLHAADKLHASSGGLSHGPLQFWFEVYGALGKDKFATERSALSARLKEMPPQSARDWEIMGLLALQERDARGAIGFFERAGRSPAAKLGLAEAYFYKDPRRALEAVTGVLSADEVLAEQNDRDPNLFLRYQLARVLLRVSEVRSDRVAEAEGVLTQLISDNSAAANPIPHPHYLLGVLYYNEARRMVDKEGFAQAIEQFDLCIGRIDAMVGKDASKITYVRPYLYRAWSQLHLTKDPGEVATIVTNVRNVMNNVFHLENPIDHYDYARLLAMAAHADRDQAGHPKDAYLTPMVESMNRAMELAEAQGFKDWSQMHFNRTEFNRINGYPEVQELWTSWTEYNARYKSLR